MDMSTATPQPGSTPKLTLNRLASTLVDLSARGLEADLQPVDLRAGEVLLQQGESGHSVYLLLAGSLGVRMEHPDGITSDLNHYAPGAIIGEMAAISGRPRAATVYALEDAHLLRLDNRAFDRLVAPETTTSPAIQQTFTERWQVTRMVGLLRPLFGNLPAPTWQALHEEFDWLRFANGDVVMRQGDTPDGMYLVMGGRLRVVAEQDGVSRTIGEIAPGESVGEFALLTGEPRTATVYALRESLVARIAPDTFTRLAHAHPDFMAAITRNIVARQQRLMEQDTTSGPSSLSIVLVPAGPALDLDAFAQQLAQGMSHFGSVEILDAQRFDTLFGKQGAATTTPGATIDSPVAAWLDEFEASCTYVLYKADPTVTDWTRRCMDRADRVLIVADPRGEPTPGPVEALGASCEMPIRSELVLWHAPETAQPEGTAAWLDARDVVAHHHVRQGAPEHMQRLARRLAGRAVALVLSGGGALGYAEMGVYQVFQEQRVPIDYVAGTSMGSIMAGAIAAGFTVTEIAQLAQTMADVGVMDITLPLAALTASKNVSDMLKQTFGTRCIEDLWIPYFCVSANLSQAEKIVHRRGPLWRAIRASMSVPGVFLPVIEDGNELVDGGIMDNFPAETMRRLCESSRIIGVHISPFRERKRQYDYDTHLSGWKILWHRLNPLAKPLRTPSMLTTMTQASLINDIHLSKRQVEVVDLMITPNVRPFGFSDYGKWEALAEAGHASAVEPLRAWMAAQPDLVGEAG